MGLLLRYHLRVQLVLFYAFFSCTHHVFGIDNNVSTSYCSHIVIVWYSQDSARYCWVFVKRNFVCESKFSWWLFNWLYCLILLNDFAFKHIFNFKVALRESVWEKLSFNLVNSKLASAFDDFFVRVRTIEITEWIACQLCESTVINFDVNKEIEVFFCLWEKSNYVGW
jgi:hypothetical protein